MMERSDFINIQFSIINIQCSCEVERSDFHKYSIFNLQSSMQSGVFKFGFSKKFREID